MKLAIHDTIRGKPAKSDTVNLGYGWSTFDCDFQDAFELITVDGCATSAALTNDNRAEQNFTSRQMFMVDIDQGMTIEELLSDEFYNNCAYGFYITPSYTDENPRFRIVFVTEDPIMNTADARNLFSGLMKMYPHSDAACKDATRIFYGTVDCKIKENQGHILPKVVIDELIALGAQANERVFKLTNTYTHHDQQYSSDFVSALLQRIALLEGNLNGRYNDWLKIAWATCHTLGVPEAIRLMKIHFKEKTNKEMHAFNTWNQSESPTIGTLIKMSGLSTSEWQELESLHFKGTRVLSKDQALKQLSKKINIT